MGAIAIGLIAGVVCYVAVTVAEAGFGYDDSLDAFGVHGVGGAWGALASGLFATTLGSGIESNAAQVMVQLKAIAFTAIFAPVSRFVILFVLKLVFGSLRVSDEAGVRGPRPLGAQRERLPLGSGGSIGGGRLHGAGARGLRHSGLKLVRMEEARAMKKIQAGSSRSSSTRCGRR